MNVATMQRELREKLTKHHQAKNMAIGEIVLGVVPVGEVGWVNGRKGEWLGNNEMKDLESGEIFKVLYCVR